MSNPAEKRVIALIVVFAKKQLKHFLYFSPAKIKAVVMVRKSAEKNLF